MRLSTIMASFENVDDGRLTDAWLLYKLTYKPSAQVGL